MAVIANGVKQKMNEQSMRSEPEQLFHTNGLMVKHRSAQLQTSLHRLVTGLRDLRQRVVSTLSLPRLPPTLPPPGEYWTNLDVESRLLVVDGAVSCGVWTPLVVLFYWGAWGILDLHLLDVLGAAWGSAFILSISISVQVTAGYCQRALNAYIGSMNSLGRSVSSRLYSFVLGWAAICHHWGLSVLWGTFRRPGMTPSVRLLVTTTVMLAGLGRASDVLPPPLSISLDPDTSDFTYTPSLLYIQPDCRVASLLDHVATVSFLTTLVHLHWVAVWDILDEIFSSCSPWVTITTSWIIGYIIVITAMIKGKKIHDAINRFTRSPAMLTECICNVCVLFANVGCVLVWRAFWIIFDLLGEHFPIYQGASDVTAAYTNWTAFGLLVFSHISTTIVHKTSNPEQQDDAAWFDFQYFGKFLTSEVEEDKDDELSLSSSRSTSRSDISASNDSVASSLNENSQCTGVYWDIYRYHDKDSSGEEYMEDGVMGKDRWATIY